MTRTTTTASTNSAEGSTERLGEDLPVHPSQHAVRARELKREEEKRCGTLVSARSQHSGIRPFARGDSAREIGRGGSANGDPRHV